MSDNDVYLPFEGEPRASNEDFDEDGFSPAVFRSRLEQKIPPTEYLVCCRCVLFSLAKSMLKMGRCVRFCCHNILFHRTDVRRRFASVSAPEFRCCSEVPLVNQKLTFDQIISCITRHDNFSLRSHRAVSLQGYLRDRRAGQTERKASEFIVIWFKLISNKDFNREKLL